MAVAVVGDPDEAVLVLHAIGVRDAAAFIQQEAFVPFLAIVGGELGVKMAAALKLVVIDEQQIAGGQTTDEESGAGIGDARRFRLRPSAAFVR